MLGAEAPQAAWNAVPGAGAHDAGAGVPEEAPYVRFLEFSSRFQSFFHLETPRNLK